MRKKILFVTISSIISVAIALLFVNLIGKDNSETVYRMVFFNPRGGESIKQLKVPHGSKIKQPTSSRTGYTLNSWCDELGFQWNFDKNVVVRDTTLYATWDTVQYTISYDSKGGDMPESYPTTYTIESDFDLIGASKGDQVFTGWFNSDGRRIDSIAPGMYGDISLTAHWTGFFKAISEDETKGLINVFESETNPNEFTVVNNPVSNRHHLFKGWYDKNGNLLSTDTSYTIIVDPNYISYIYSRYMTDEEETSWDNTHGVNPQIIGSRVLFGMYPQSNVNDATLIEQLNKLKKTRFNNFYYYNHEYYVNRNSKLARDLDTHELLSIRQFDNGDVFEEGESYWFKVDPISWSIAKQTGNKYLMRCEKLIDVKQYHSNSVVRTIDGQTIYANNYKFSDIRNWLNSDFVNSAFSFNLAFLNIMEVDNSKNTTATPDSKQECENTFDIVTLPSYKDCMASTLVELRSKTTDLVRVSGANYSVDESNIFSGYYWTRSPIQTKKDNGTAVSRCNMNGTVNNDYVGWGGSCILPIISISI